MRERERMGGGMVVMGMGEQECVFLSSFFLL